MEVDATGGWGEGECVIPGEICSSALGLVSSRGGMRGEQKSAEGVVAIAHSGEGPNVEGKESAEPRWMREARTGGLRCLRTPGR